MDDEQMAVAREVGDGKANGDGLGGGGLSLADREEQPSSQTPSNPSNSMTTLLAIDDDRTVLHLIRQAFKDAPFHIATARDVREGLEIVKSGVDVILLDIMLPDISG